MDLLVRRYLSIRSAHTPYLFLKDKIVYLSDITGIPIPWIYYAGRHDILFPWEERVGDMLPSPRGYLAFLSDEGGNEEWQLYLYDGEGISRISEGGINRLGVWSDDGRLLVFSSNVENGVDFFIYEYDVDKGVVRKVVELDGDNVPSEWLGNGRVLVVHRNTNLDSDVYLVDLEKGTAKNLTRHGGEAIHAYPVHLGEGKVALVTNRGSEYAGIALLDLGQGQLSYLVRGSWDVEFLRASRDKSLVVYGVNEDGRTALYVTTKTFSLAHRASLPIGVVQHVDVGRDLVALALSSPLYGLEVWTYYVKYAPEKLTESPKLGTGPFVEPRAEGFESFDGLEISVLIYDAGEKTPVLVYLHGGPEAQERPEFKPLIQLLVKLGVTVIAPNYRGSSGYGRSFVHLDDVDRRWDAVRDIGALVDWIESRGRYSGRMCVYGGSYGGYLALMSLAAYPDVWACGVELCGIVNLVTFLENTKPWRRRYRIPEYGDPEKDRELLLNLSPIAHADKIKAPLMVVHGVNDPRVPVSEARQLVSKLRELGREVEYVELEGEGHGIAKVHNRVKVYSKVVEFLMKHLKA